MTALVCAFLPPFESSRAAGSLAIASRSDSTTGNAVGNGDSGLTGVAADHTGDAIAFDSKARNFDPAAIGVGDVFRRRVAPEITHLMSLCGNQAQELPTRYPAISAGGDAVTFSSRQEFQQGCDPNSTEDVWLASRDVGQPPTIVKVSQPPTGGHANGDSVRSSVSEDARLVAFESTADNFGWPDTNGVSDVYVRDTTSNNVVLASAQGEQALGGENPVASDDGRWVAFEYQRLVPGAVPIYQTEIMLRDLQTGTLAIVSRPDATDQGYANGNSRNPDITSDGATVAFESDATNLTNDTGRGGSGVFVREVAANHTERIDLDDGDGDVLGDSVTPAISGTGSLVAFASKGDYTGNDNGGVQDVLVKSRASRALTPVSVNDSGDLADADSELPDISVDGAQVAFASGAQNLDPGAGNGQKQVYRQRSDGGGGDPGDGEFWAGVFPDSGKAPMLSNFDASDVGPDATPITEYKWTTGDGAVYTDQTVTHVYGAAGTYTLRFDFKTAGGIIDFRTWTVSVTPQDLPPVVSLESVSKDLVDLSLGGGVADQTVTLTASAGDDGGVAAIEFDYDGNYTVDDVVLTDGDPKAVTKGVTHVYGVVGSYRPHARALDNYGQRSMWSTPKAVEVVNGQPFPDPDSSGRTIEHVYLPNPSSNTGAILPDPYDVIGALPIAGPAIVSTITTLVNTFSGGIWAGIFTAILALVTDSPATTFSKPLDMKWYTIFPGTPWEKSLLTGQMIVLDVDIADGEVRFIANIFSDKQSVHCDPVGEVDFDPDKLFDDLNPFDSVEVKQVCDSATLKGWGLCGKLRFSGGGGASFGICEYDTTWDDDQAIWEIIGPDVEFSASWKNLLALGWPVDQIDHYSGGMLDNIGSDLQVDINPKN